MSRWEFKSEEALKDFDMKLNMACFSKGFSIVGIDLLRSKKIYSDEGAQQIFYSILDIKINIFNVYACVRDLQILWPRIDPESVFRFQRLWFEFVCLYRAFYEKYMYLMVRCGWPDHLRKFEKAKSRNAEFQKIVLRNNAAYVADGVFLSIPPGFSRRCSEHITYVNDQYRTPEVHGAGKARKWILSERPKEEQQEWDKFVALVEDMPEFLNLVGVVAGGREYCRNLEALKQEGGAKSVKSDTG